jgi:hypothetical protein
MPDGGQIAPRAEPAANRPAAQHHRQPDQPEHETAAMPAPAVGHPGLAHPGNAPMRAAAMAQLQRGGGNRAAQAAVAAPTPSPAAPAPDQAETGDTPDDDAPAAALDKPPWRDEPVRAAYLGDPLLSADDLHYPGKPAQPAARGRHAPPAAASDQRNAASEASIRRHAELRRTGETLQAAALAHTSQTASTAMQGYEAAQRRLEGQEFQALSEVDSLSAQQRAALESVAEAAGRRLEEAAGTARAAILAASKEGLHQVDVAAAKSAAGVQHEIAVAVMAALEKINAERKDCETQGDAALKGIKDWQDQPDYKGANSYKPGMLAAINEMRRARVPALAAPMKPEVEKRKAEELKAYDVMKASRPGELRHGKTATALRNATDAFRAQGHRAIKQTQAQSLSGIDQMASNGARSLAQMRDAGRAQLAAQRQAARARITLAGRGRRQSLQSEFAAGLNTLRGAALNGLTPFSRAPGELRNAARMAAPQGPEAVLKTVRTAPPGIEEAMENARRQHADRIAANSAAMQGRVVTQEGLHASGLAAEQARAQAELPAAVAQTETSMRQAVEGIAQGMNATAAQVSAAATQLVSGFLGTLGQQTANAKKGFGGENKNFEGEPPKPAGKPDAKPDTKPLPEADPAAKDGKDAKQGKGGKPAPDAADKPAGADEKAKPEQPLTLGQRRAGWEGFFKPFETPEENPSIKNQLEAERTALDKRLGERFAKLHAAITANELGDAAAALRGITAIQAGAIRELHAVNASRSIEEDLQIMWFNRSTFHPYRDDDYYHAALSYLHGDTTVGVRQELSAARGVFSADFGRVDAILGSLTAEQLTDLIDRDGEAGLAGASFADMREHLSDTNLSVFNALVAKRPDAGPDNRYATAEALKIFDEIKAAQKNGDLDALKKAVARISGGSGYQAWQTEKADDKRAAIVSELAKLLPPEPGQPGAGSAEDRILAFTTKAMEINVQSMDPDGMGGDYSYTVTVNEDQHALFKAAISGPDKKNPTIALVAGLHDELNRTQGDGPRVSELANLLIDKRLDPVRNDLNPQAQEQAQEDAKAAKAERDAAIIAYAQRYDTSLPKDAKPDLDAAKAFLRAQIDTAFRKDADGAAFVAGLAIEAHPTPEVAATGLQWAINHDTTIDAGMVHTLLSHMDRDEIEKTKTSFKERTHRDLLDELGVYGRSGSGAGLSGDDRLEAERDLLGVPRNQKEDVEVQHFTIQQQRDETGSVGKWFAKGSYAEQDMNEAEREMFAAIGRDVTFDRQGHLLTPGVFDAGSGKLIGGDPDRLRRATDFAPLAAKNYTAKVDQMADIATTVIAVLGAIAAVVITVLTAGAAGPLVVAALVTGLATMAAKEAIKGGRYGWKEAAFDLGMTAVQMLTAGVGAGLGAASRGGMEAIEAASVAEQAFKEGMVTAEAMEAAATAAKPGQILGNAVADHALIGATTGAISSAGQTALTPDTWKEGGAKGLENLLFGTFRGALGGMVTSVASSKIDAIGGNKGIGAMMAGLGKDRAAGMLPQMVLRGGLKSASSGISAMFGRGAELSFDAATGHFKGNADTVLNSLTEAGAKAAARGFFEGAAEAPAARAREGIESRAAQKRYGVPEAGPAGPRPNAAAPAPRVNPGAAEPGGEPPAAQKTPAEAPARATPPEIPETEAGAAPRTRPPRAADEPPEPVTVKMARAASPEFAELWDQSVIQGAAPHDVDEAFLIYGNAIEATPNREAAVYRNPQTGEYIIVQGVETTVAVGRSAGGELEAPQPAGIAQRWKEVLENGDVGSWELVSHFHPGDEATSNTRLSSRLPSGVDGDFGTVDAESVLAGDQPRVSRIHYIQDGKFEHTDFGIDPANPAGRYWVEYADPVTGARSRESFATLAQYHGWFEDSFGFAPGAAPGPAPAAAAPPRLPESGPPPPAMRAEIDQLLTAGPKTAPPAAEAVADAAQAFRAGKGTLGDFEVLLAHAAADARAMLAREGPAGAASPHAQYQSDLAEASWQCLTGQCGAGRDYLATSLATFLMDAQTPATIRRYQAFNVIEAGQHGFAVIEVPGTPPMRYLLDPTFAQFMRPAGETLRLNGATANFLAEHPQGSFMARDLLRDGFIPLTEDSALLYARAMGAPPELAPAAAARLLAGGHADLTETVGGPAGRPPVTDINSNIDTLSAAEVVKFIGQRINRIEMRDGADETTRQRLAAFQARVEAAVARGPVRPAQELAAETAAPGGAPERGPAASGIPLSPSFRGLPDAPEPGAAQKAAVHAEIPAALSRLEAAGALPDAPWQRLPDDGGPPKIQVLRNNEAGETELVTVVFTTGKTPNGEPASFPAAPTRNAQGELELQVIVSNRHPPGIVEQALAHEITEIAHPPGLAAAEDRLAPGGGKLDPAGPLDQLSGHDRGRLAQLAVIARQIAEIMPQGYGPVQHPRDALTVARLRNEAEILVAHLGLVEGVPDAVSDRARLALRALAQTPEAAALLQESMNTAKLNPVLRMRDVSLRDFDILANRRALAADLGQDALAPETSIRYSAARLVKALGIVENAGGKWQVAPLALAQARAALGPAGFALLEAGIRQAVLSTDMDPAAAERAYEARALAHMKDQQELVRQRFADRPQFQQLDEFLDADNRREPRNLLREGRLREDWMSGKFMNDRSIAVSLLDSEQPDAGFSVLPADKRRLPSGGAALGANAAAAADERRAAIIARETAATETDRKAANLRINKATEHLGVLAGEDFARRFLAPGMSDLTALTRATLPSEEEAVSAGANTIDLGFESEAHRTLVVIECKGGNAGRGTRRDITNQLRVEQGTRDYLEAVAAQMQSRGKTPAEVAFGTKLLEALRTEGKEGAMKIIYLQVRQPIDKETGDPEPYVVDQFDLRKRR